MLKKCKDSTKEKDSERKEDSVVSGFGICISYPVFTGNEYRVSLAQLGCCDCDLWIGRMPCAGEDERNRHITDKRIFCMRRLDEFMDVPRLSRWCSQNVRHGCRSNRIFVVV